jgi:hypothetical protein
MVLRAEQARSKLKEVFIVASTFLLSSKHVHESQYQGDEQGCQSHTHEHKKKLSSRCETQLAMTYF